MQLKRTCVSTDGNTEHGNDENIFDDYVGRAGRILYNNIRENASSRSQAAGIPSATLASRCIIKRCTTGSWGNLQRVHGPLPAHRTVMMVVHENSHIRWLTTMIIIDTMYKYTSTSRFSIITIKTFDSKMQFTITNGERIRYCCWTNNTIRGVICNMQKCIIIYRCMREY
jgi:hypothetical protein